MKRYITATTITASITSEVNDIVNSEKDIMYQDHFESFWNMDGLEWYLSKSPEITDYEIVEVTPDSPYYQEYRGGLNLEYYNPPRPYVVLKWVTSKKYNATRTEELNAILKRVKTFAELKELYNAIGDTGLGIWWYTKRNNNPLNSAFWEVPGQPDYVEYVVDRHSAVLKCKISNLYKVLKIY